MTSLCPTQEHAGPAPHHLRTLRALRLMLCISMGCTASLAGALDATPVAKVGACPSGYQVSGAYCRPGNSARFALEKTGACPSGYHVSGAYCLAGSAAGHAIPRVGACPANYAVSGDYCLATHTRR